MLNTSSSTRSLHLFLFCCPSCMRFWHSPSSNLHSNKPLSLPCSQQANTKILWKKVKKKKNKKKSTLPLLQGTASCSPLQKYPRLQLKDDLFFCPHHSNKAVVLKPHCFDVLKPLSDPDYTVTYHQGYDDLYISCGQFVLKCILCKSYHSLIAPSSDFFCHLFQL